MVKLELITPAVPTDRDSTFCFPAEHECSSDDPTRTISTLKQLLGSTTSHDDDVQLGSGPRGRGVFVWAERRKKVHLTFRPKIEKEQKGHKRVHLTFRLGRPIRSAAAVHRRKKFQLTPRPMNRRHSTTQRHLPKEHHYLSPLVWGAKPDHSIMEAHGLIIVCGQTHSGKSTLARKLLQDYLKAHTATVKHRHLVCLGNPVDFGDPPVGWTVTNRWLMRSKEDPRNDTLLKDAIDDALRQDPGAIYLDEVRDLRQWQIVIRFAQTGHLIVTTAHAADIPDMILQLFRVMNVRRRSDTPVVTRCLHAIIHTRLNSGAAEPELWISGKGGSALRAYGLAGLVPTNSAQAAYISRDRLKALPHNNQ